MTGAGNEPIDKVLGAATPDLVAPASQARGRPGAKELWRRVLLAVGVLLALVSAVAALARQAGWESGPLAYAVALLPWMTTAAGLAVLLGIVTRSWLLVAAALVVAAMGWWWLSPLYTADSTLPAAAQVRLTVATVNLTIGAADAESVVEVVRDRGIDLLALEELTPEARAGLRAAGLDELMPFSFARPEVGITGTGLWSRRPLGSPDAIDGFVSQAVRAGINSPVGRLTVLAVHPAAPGPFNHDRWDADIAHLRDVLAGEADPVLVLGDFNTTRDHRVFREIEGLGYVDAADEAGAGLLPTFPQGRAPVPLIAIDHVMRRGATLRAGSVATVQIPGADHRALVVQYFDTGAANP